MIKNSLPSLLLVLLLTGACAAADDCTIETTYGPVVGTTDGRVRVFKGLPFAAPPVGDLRWKPPVSPTPWTLPRQAKEFAPSCPQAADRIVPAQARQSEDCLYLNVWAPQGAQKLPQELPEKLPVMVFIHGGGFTKGSGSQSTYASDALARHGVLLVTINYRLGHFGFFCHPALSAESPERTCGNYGLMDQIMALRWVHDNIGRFGGDPANVTIFGESAGAVSVGLLMASPLARGLFHRAILESGTVPLRMQTRAEAEQKGQALQRTLGVGDGPEALAQLRRVPAEKLLASGAGDDRLPGASIRDLLCVGGYGLPEAPADVFAAGRQALVPVIAGSNGDEGTLWSRRLPINTALKWRVALRALLKEDAPEAARLYPVQDDTDVQEALDQLVGDPFVAGARRMVRWMTAAEPDVYLYHFTRVNAAGQRTTLGAFHGSELSYVFGSFPSRMGKTVDDEELSEQMIGYWTRFARTGDPNGVGATVWPKYTAAQDQHLVFDVPLTVGQGLRREQCDLWDKIQSR